MSVRGYNITNDSNTAYVADLRLNSPTPGTPVIVHGLDQQPTGNTNQMVCPSVTLILSFSLTHFIQLRSGESILLPLV
jgi:hypothetical protein